MTKRKAERLSKYDDDLAALVAATGLIEREYPLPRCEHGLALRDHAGDVLTCPKGCVLPPTEEPRK